MNIIQGEPWTMSHHVTLRSRLLPNHSLVRHVMSTMSALDIKLRRATKVYHEGVSYVLKLSSASQKFCL